MAIDRRENLSLAEFRSKYVARSQPVILTDAIDHWPASRKWNFDFFETEYGFPSGIAEDNARFGKVPCSKHVMIWRPARTFFS